MMRGDRRAVVVAFDGLVADTLGVRARAVTNALAAERVPCDWQQVRELVAGRTLAECVRAAAIAALRDVDETTIDLAALRAADECASTMQGSIALCAGATGWIQRAAQQRRVVVRADSARRDVERVLDAAALTMFVTLLRCGDDAATGRGEPMLESSWAAIIDRLSAQGIAPESTVGLECSSEDLLSTIRGARVRRVADITEEPAIMSPFGI